MEIKELCQAWLAAKQAENEAAKRRIEIEKHLAAALRHPEDGSKTHTVEGFKVTVTGRLNFRADIPQLISLCEQLPPNMRPIKTETVLDRKGAKWIRNNEPEAWAIISPAIEVEPGKPYVKIEAIIEE